MKYSIAIKYKDAGGSVIEHYKNKAAADAREAELYEAGHFGEIRCFWIWPDSAPEKRARIDFNK